MNPALAEAVAFAEAHQTPWPRDLRAHLEAGCFEPPPGNAVIGPTAPRGGPAGVVFHQGRRVAAWGDTRRADMRFSVAKSHLALLAGIARTDGLLPGLDAPVSASVARDAFTGPRNSRVSWRHLLTKVPSGKARCSARATASTAAATSASRGRGRSAARGRSPNRAAAGSTTTSA